MQFTVDRDQGDIITGWLAPDDPEHIPSVLVRVPGRPDVRLQANVHRQDIVELGLHRSGQVGFLVASDLIPDLAALLRLEIVEAQSLMPIYSRFDSNLHLERKLYVFDATVVPQRQLVKAISGHFALSYPNFEQYGLETATVVVTSPHRNSIVTMGRANYNRYSFWLSEMGYTRTALLRDPFEELAERLMFLSLLARSNSLDACSAYLTGLGPLVDFARDLPFTDPKGLRKAFRDATPDQREVLMSPMTRALGCEIGENPRDAHVSRALDNLASMDVVGTRARFELFRVLLQGAVGLDVFDGEAPIASPTVEVFASTLRQLRGVEDLIAEDMRLYALVSDAIESGRALNKR